MNVTRKNSLALVGVMGLLTVSLAACSSNNSSSTSSTSAAPKASSSSSASMTPSASPTPVAQIANLTGVHTQVTLDPGFLAALKSLKLTPGVTGTAALDAKTGVLTFPITGGNVTYYDPASHVQGGYVQGVVDHNGSGITLTAGSTTVKLSNFVIHPQSGSYLSGDVQVNKGQVLHNVNIFTLDGTTLKPLSKDPSGNGVLEGTRVLVSPDAAALLNKTFNTTAVKGGNNGLLVGIAKITVKIPQG